MKKLILGVVFFAMSLQVGGGALYAVAEQKGQAGDTSSYFHQFVQAIGSRANATKNELSLLWGYLLKKYIHGEKTTQKEDERAKRIQKKLGIAIGTLVAIVAIIMGIKWYKNRAGGAAQGAVQTRPIEKLPKAPVQDKDLNEKLHAAVLVADVEAIKSLIAQGADVNATNGWGDTLLHAAMETGDIKVVRELLNNNADVNRVDMFDYAPLDRAVEKENVEMIKELLRNKADVNRVDMFGYTPLHYAVKKGNVELVKLFIASGADKNIKSIDGKTPLSIAKEKKAPEIIKILESRGNKE